MSSEMGRHEHGVLVRREIQKAADIKKAAALERRDEIRNECALDMRERFGTRFDSFKQTPSYLSVLLYLREMCAVLHPDSEQYKQHMIKLIDLEAPHSISGGALTWDEKAFGRQLQEQRALQERPRVLQKRPRGGAIAATPVNVSPATVLLSWARALPPGTQATEATVMSSRELPESVFLQEPSDMELGYPESPSDDMDVGRFGLPDRSELFFEDYSIGF